ncbi:uncharacterized protein PG986_001236 [Apiospora aurea]|uniref:Glucose receptor Git3 N-terminal domain-containing protein n=1 Tax=Apiospora aurea TaxID=335848 RepID=A0ABR1QWF3_9PEZI
MDTIERGNGTLYWENDTLHPLGGLQQGLIAVAVVSIVSFVTTAAFFFYLLFKLIIDSGCCRRRRRQRQRRRQQHQSPGETRSEISLDLSLSTPAQRQLDGGGHDGNPVSRSHSTRSGNNHDNSINNQTQDADRAPSAREPIRNPFPFLIIGILGAECYTTLGFSLNLVWVLRDGIFVKTPTCALQGWLNSMGILYSSIAYMSMATSNYLAIVWGFRARNKTIIITNLVGWLLTIGLVTGGIVSRNNGEEFGGWYVRANAWCWINPKYTQERIWSCWAWVLFSIPYTCFLYALIFWEIWRQKPCRRHQAPAGQVALTRGAANLPSGYHPAFFVYPFVYIACTIPLAIIRLKQSMNDGKRDSGQDEAMDPAYYYVAALMVSSNGFWNTILWLTTMFVSTPEDIRHAGLETFAFIRTPEWRKFGNMVWISGPMSKRAITMAGRGRGMGGHRHGSDNNDGSWWWWRMGGETRLRNSGSTPQGPSREHLHLEDNGIQMDVVTTITVEEAVDRDRDKDVSVNGRLSHKHDKHDDMDSIA